MQRLKSSITFKEGGEGGGQGEMGEGWGRGEKGKRGKGEGGRGKGEGENRKGEMEEGGGREVRVGWGATFK